MSPRQVRFSISISDHAKLLEIFCGLVCGISCGCVAECWRVRVGSRGPHGFVSLDIRDGSKKENTRKNDRASPIADCGRVGSLFGISAREIEKQTGYSTLNLATHAALGPAYILNNAKSEARPGDTVLLVLEYELYMANQRSAVWLDYLVARDPRYFHGLSLREEWNVFMLTPQQRLIEGLKNRFRSRARAEHPYPAGPYNPDYIDAWATNRTILALRLRLISSTRPSGLRSHCPSTRRAFPLSRLFVAGRMSIRFVCWRPIRIDSIKRNFARLPLSRPFTRSQSSIATSIFPLSEPTPTLFCRETSSSILFIT